jgi:hypothetical protein
VSCATSLALRKAVVIIGVRIICRKKTIKDSPSAVHKIYIYQIRYYLELDKRHTIVNLLEELAIIMVNLVALVVDRFL